jgi:signal transduction histidine kinase
MVSSVAHEINNPLQTITNCLYLTRKGLSDDSPIHTYLEMASAETQRLVNLVAQLRELYRSRTVSPEVHDLTYLLQSVQSLLAPQLLSGRVQWLQPAGLPGYSVSIISDRLKQVFINVVMNAIEAMQPAGGQLLVDVLLAADGQQVGVSFKDTGPGIPAALLSRLFEPFFTTKAQGLGLGLAICYEIAQQHSGQITAESQPGQGAVFTVWLPLAQPVEGGTTQKSHGDPNDATH